MASSPSDIGGAPPVRAVPAAAGVASATAPRVSLTASSPAPRVKLAGDPTAIAREHDDKMARADVAAAAQALNTYIDQRRNDLRFRVDELSGRVVVSVVDSKSGEVLRQIPGEAALKIAHQIVTQGHGLAGERA